MGEGEIHRKDELNYYTEPVFSLEFVRGCILRFINILDQELLMDE